jgi:hypothetical protein
MRHRLDCGRQCIESPSIAEGGVAPGNSAMPQEVLPRERFGWGGETTAYGGCVREFAAAAAHAGVLRPTLAVDTLSTLMSSERSVPN